MISKFGLWFFHAPNKLAKRVWKSTLCSRGKHTWVKTRDSNKYASYPFKRKCARCYREEQAYFDEERFYSKVG